MNLAILIPDGVGVRNFVLGRFLQSAAGRSRVTLFNAVPPEILPQYKEGVSDDVVWETLIPYRETPLSSTLRYSLIYSHMYWADTQSMRFNRKLPVSGSWRRQCVDKLARGIGALAVSPRRMALLDRAHRLAVSRLPEFRHYRRLFTKSRPSILFCSHQRPPAILPAVLAARSLGIPTATFIFSWDNLTSKGRIAAPFDHYFVWSEHMRGELLRYYPHVSPENVHVVGTPQFDLYGDDRSGLSREEFFRRIGADPSRPLICYSGGDTGNAPEEPRQVRVLMEHIRSGVIRGNPQVLLRPSPVDKSGRYEALVREFPEIIFSPPRWMDTKPGDWDYVLPLVSDIRFLADLTRHADLNINLASTMTLDFAIHDKPVINIAFDVAEPPSFGIPLWDFFYKFEHYRPVVELGAARFARSPAELAAHVNAYLSDPALDRAGRKRLVDLQVGVPVGRSGERILETLERITAAVRS